MLSMIPEVIIDHDQKNSSGFPLTFHKGKHLGSGAFATCYEARRFPEGDSFCLKFVDKKSCKKGDKNGHYNKLMTEMRIHRNMNHKNIVGLYHTFETDSYHILVLKLCKGGNLLEKLTEARYFTEAQAYYYARQLAEALIYLKKMNIIHRDLKLQNLLLDNQGNLYVADFGLCCQLSEDSPLRYTVCGTPNYLAPEILNKTGHSFSVDVWSFGVALFALTTSSYPFLRSSDQKIENTFQLICGNVWEFPSDCSLSFELKELIKNILVLDVEKRPKIEDIMKCDWFIKMENARAPISALKSSQLVSISLENVSYRVEETDPESQHENKTSTQQDYSPPARRQSTCNQPTKTSEYSQRERENYAYLRSKNDNNRQGMAHRSHSTRSASVSARISAPSIKLDSDNSRKTDHIQEIPTKEVKNVPAPLQASAPTSSGFIQGTGIPIYNRSSRHRNGERPEFIPAPFIKRSNSATPLQRSEDVSSSQNNSREVPLQSHNGYRQITVCAQQSETENGFVSAKNPMNNTAMNNRPVAATAGQRLMHVMETGMQMKDWAAVEQYRKTQNISAAVCKAADLLEAQEMARQAGAGAVHTRPPSLPVRDARGLLPPPIVNRADGGAVRGISVTVRRAFDIAANVVARGLGVQVSPSKSQQKVAIGTLAKDYNVVSTSSNNIVQTAESKSLLTSSSSLSPPSMPSAKSSSNSRIDKEASFVTPCEYPDDEMHSVASTKTQHSDISSSCHGVLYRNNTESLNCQTDLHHSITNGTEKGLTLNASILKDVPNIQQQNQKNITDLDSEKKKNCTGNNQALVNLKNFSPSPNNAFQEDLKTESVNTSQRALESSTNIQRTLLISEKIVPRKLFSSSSQQSLNQQQNSTSASCAVPSLKEPATNSSAAVSFMQRRTTVDSVGSSNESESLPGLEKRNKKNECRGYATCSSASTDTNGEAVTACSSSATTTSSTSKTALPLSYQHLHSGSSQSSLQNNSSKNITIPSYLSVCVSSNTNNMEKVNGDSVNTSNSQSNFNVNPNNAKVSGIPDFRSSNFKSSSSAHLPPVPHPVRQPSPVRELLPSCTPPYLPPPLNTPATSSLSGPSPDRTRLVGLVTTTSASNLRFNTAVSAKGASDAATSSSHMSNTRGLSSPSKRESSPLPFTTVKNTAHGDIAMGAMPLELTTGPKKTVNLTSRRYAGTSPNAKKESEVIEDKKFRETSSASHRIINTRISIPGEKQLEVAATAAPTLANMQIKDYQSATAIAGTNVKSRDFNISSNEVKLATMNASAAVRSSISDQQSSIPVQRQTQSHVSSLRQSVSVSAGWVATQERITLTSSEDSSIRENCENLAATFETSSSHTRKITLNLLVSASASNLLKIPSSNAIDRLPSIMITRLVSRPSGNSGGRTSASLGIGFSFRPKGALTNRAHGFMAYADTAASGDLFYRIKVSSSVLHWYNAEYCKNFIKIEGKPPSLIEVPLSNLMRSKPAIVSMRQEFSHILASVKSDIAGVDPTALGYATAVPAVRCSNDDSNFEGVNKLVSHPSAEFSLTQVITFPTGFVALFNGGRLRHFSLSSACIDVIVTSQLCTNGRLLRIVNVFPSQLRFTENYKAYILTETEFREMMVAHRISSEIMKFAEICEGVDGTAVVRLKSDGVHGCNIWNF